MKLYKLSTAIARTQGYLLTYNCPPFYLDLTTIYRLLHYNLGKDTAMLILNQAETRCWAFALWISFSKSKINIYSGENRKQGGIWFCKSKTEQIIQIPSFYGTWPQYTFLGFFPHIALESTMFLHINHYFLIVKFHKSNCQALKEVCSFKLWPRMVSFMK